VEATSYHEFVDNLLTVFLWTALFTVLLAAILFFAGRAIALRLVRKLAEQTEGRLAARLEGSLRRPGLPRQRRLSDATRAQYLAQIDRTARVMDRLIPLPVVGGIGLDSLLGLVPVAGDVASFAASSLIIIRAAQLGASETLLTRLIAIMCTDLLVGAVPIIGDLTDVAYQANVKCARLIREFVEEQQDSQSRTA